MSRPLSRRPPAASVQGRRPPDASGTSPGTNSEFMTQPELKTEEWHHSSNLSPSVIRETQTRASGHRHMPASRSSRTVASASALSSHRSSGRNERAENRRQRQSSHNSPIPQPTVSSSRSSPTKSKGKRATTEHSPAADDDPPLELLAAQHDLLELWTKNKGLSSKVVHKGVIQVITSYFPHLKWDQSEPTRSQRSTMGPDAEPTKRFSDPNNHTSALTLDNIHGSQHGSKSSRDVAGGMLHDRGGTSPMLTTPGVEDRFEQVAAFPANKKGRSTPAPRLKLGGLMVTIKNEQEFREAFLHWHLEVIGAGNFEINLLDLAKATVKDVKPKFQQRLRDADEQERQRKRWRGQIRAQSERTNTARHVDITEEIWQVLFTIVANMFVFGLQPLYHTFKAASQQSLKRATATERSRPGRPPPTDTTPDFNDRNRRNGGVADNSVAGPISEGTLFGVGKEDLTELIQSMRWWWAREDKSQVQMDKVYSYYKKLQTVRLYDAMMESWKANEESIQNFLRQRGYQRMDAATFLLSYIGQQITPLREEQANNTFAILPEDSELIKDLSDMILGFRPICSLVEAFGEGVLVLLIDKAEKYVPGMVGEGQEYYPQHERIRDVALSLCKVDRRKYEGQLRNQFTELEEKVLRPVIRLRTCGNTGNVSLDDCPKRRVFDGRDVGKRISCILVRIAVDGSTVQKGVRRSKRRMSNSSVEQAEDGEQGRSKRHRNTSESSEDEESGNNESEGGPDNGDDLYDS